MMSLSDALRPGQSFAWFAGYDMRDTALIQRVPSNSGATAQTPAQRDELCDHKLANTMSTIDLLQFFARTIAIISVIGVLLNIWLAGQVLTHANIWFAATVALTVLTDHIGRRHIGDRALALRTRNSMILGLSLDMLAFAGASGLSTLPLVAWLFTL